MPLRDLGNQKLALGKNCNHRWVLVSAMVRVRRRRQSSKWMFHIHLGSTNTNHQPNNSSLCSRTGNRMSNRHSLRRCRRRCLTAAMVVSVPVWAVWVCYRRRRLRSSGNFRIHCCPSNTSRQPNSNSQCSHTGSRMSNRHSLHRRRQRCQVAEPAWR